MSKLIAERRVPQGPLTETRVSAWLTPQREIELDLRLWRRALLGAEAVPTAAGFRLKLGAASDFAAAFRSCWTAGLEASAFLQYGRNDAA